MKLTAGEFGGAALMLGLLLVLISKRIIETCYDPSILPNLRHKPARRQKSLTPVVAVGAAHRPAPSAFVGLPTPTAVPLSMGPAPVAVGQLAVMEPTTAKSMTAGRSRRIGVAASVSSVAVVASFALGVATRRR